LNARLTTLLFKIITVRKSKMTELGEIWQNLLKKAVVWREREKKKVGGGGGG
jgi:hypothetical protein